MKTADMIGPALDWAVAKAQGRKEIRVFGRTRPSDRGWIEVRFNLDPRATTARFDPSENWSQGGPLIEREKFEIFWHHMDQRWFAANNQCAKWDDQTGEYIEGSDCKCDGPTPLIAAMRCYVASKLGDEVDVPKELI